jgi:hypothetical protein
MLSKALEMGVCFHRGPVYGEHGEHSFTRAFEERHKFLYLGTFLMRDMINSLKRGPVNGQLS